jgi:hypothetical protein
MFQCQHVTSGSILGSPVLVIRLPHLSEGLWNDGVIDWHFYDRKASAAMSGDGCVRRMSDSRYCKPLADLDDDTVQEWTRSVTTHRGSRVDEIKLFFGQAVMSRIPTRCTYQKQVFTAIDYQVCQGIKVDILKLHIAIRRGRAMPLFHVQPGQFGGPKISGQESGSASARYI